MDLQQAYDRLPRTGLAEGLTFGSCPASLQTVVLQWLFEADYHLSHRVQRPAQIHQTFTWCQTRLQSLPARMDGLSHHVAQQNRFSNQFPVAER